MSPFTLNVPSDKTEALTAPFTILFNSKPVTPDAGMLYKPAPLPINEEETTEAVKAPLILTAFVVDHIEPVNANKLSPEVPSVPLEPEVPDEPEVPEEPEEPDEPDEPFDPDEPLEPEVPAVPEEPDVPAEPDEPSVPLDPEEPDEPYEPAVPEEPADPEVPEVPEEFDLYSEPFINKLPVTLLDPLTFTWLLNVPLVLVNVVIVTPLMVLPAMLPVKSNFVFPPAPLLFKI